MNRRVFHVVCLLGFFFIFFISIGLCDTANQSTDPSQDDVTHPEVTQEALSKLKLDADNGDPGALYQLGLLYETGTGNSLVPQSTLEAARLYKKAADKGYMPARNKMAVIYYHGLAGFEKDTKKTETYFKQSIDEGSVDAMFMLGRIYLEGAEEIERKFEEGTRLITAAALKGNEFAMDELGVMYFNGTKVINRDRGKAYAWYRKAALKGYPPAMVHLGSMYYYGVSPVEKDEEKGIEWVEKAVHKGDEQAYELLVKWGGGKEKERTVTLELKKGGNIYEDAKKKSKKTPEPVDQDKPEDKPEDKPASDE